ncbi:MAG: hypothetical protein IJ548_09070 [Paludibacteraceae bacterium]|nr:hypothetical protein [Paludibacteraceae bacterium]MBQ8714717.1 hypothetical protein [Prevotella sp.]
MKNISLNYREKLEKSMQVTFDSVDVEDGQEVERMWLACNLEKLPIDECPVFGSECVQGCVYFWDKPYPEVEDVALIKNYFQK